ncbi:MAG: CBS domain-containing protein [Candidatus Methanoperedens sp.]|nr:CBS domain-containing protein [Candidatus Methanoperedens sp.]
MSKINHILLKNPVVVSTGEKLRNVAKLMNNNKVSSVLVRKNRMLAGIVSVEDIMYHVAKKADMDIDVDKVMHFPKLTIDAEKWLLDAIIIFDCHKASHITVVENGENVAIIRADDILHTYRFNRESSDRGLERQ